MIATLHADATLLFKPTGWSGRAGPSDALIYYAPIKDADERRRARREQAVAANAPSLSGTADAAGAPA